LPYTKNKAFYAPFIDMGILLAPILLIVFWYRDFSLGAFKKTFEIIAYATKLLSLGILLRTFFKPIKNEYRAGLVWFSIGMGIVIKAVLIPIILAILLALTVVLLAIDLLILALPILLVKFIIL